MIESGLILFIAVLIVMAKTPRKPLKIILGYDYVVDILASIILFWALTGTFSGAMTAAVSGIAISIALFLTKRIIGYVVFERGRGWTEYKPAWRHEA